MYQCYLKGENFPILMLRADPTQALILKEIVFSAVHNTVCYRTHAGLIPAEDTRFANASDQPVLLRRWEPHQMELRDWNGMVRFQVTAESAPTDKTIPLPLLPQNAIDKLDG